MPYTFNPFTGTLDATTTGSGSGQAWVVDQIPVESPNGVRTTFTVPNSDTYIAGFILPSLNGLNQTHTNDFTETNSTQITFVSAPLATDTIRLIYRTT